MVGGSPLRFPVSGLLAIGGFAGGGTGAGAGAGAGGGPTCKARGSRL